MDPTNELRGMNLSDVSIRHSFTDEEYGPAGSRRKLFKSDGESDADISTKGHPLKSPKASAGFVNLYNKNIVAVSGSSTANNDGNIIKIIDKYEISEERAKLQSTRLQKDSRLQSNRVEKREGQEVEESSQTKKEVYSDQEKDKATTDKLKGGKKTSQNPRFAEDVADNDDVCEQETHRNLEKKLPLHHQRFSTQSDDNSDEVEHDLLYESLEKQHDPSNKYYYVEVEAKSNEKSSQNGIAEAQDKLSDFKALQTKAPLVEGGKEMTEFEKDNSNSSKPKAMTHIDHLTRIKDSGRAKTETDEGKSSPKKKKLEKS